jgi:cytochrome c5
VVAFLAAQSLFETKCSACHDLEKPLSKREKTADWQATVERMAAKRAGHLTVTKVAEIAAFLSAVRPLP